MNLASRKNIEYLITKAKDYISRLYPLIYSEEFKYSEKDFYVPACNNPTLLNKRIELINSALRYNQATAKTKSKQPLESLTNFKPFNLKELKFNVCLENDAK